MKTKSLIVAVACLPVLSLVADNTAGFLAQAQIRDFPVDQNLGTLDAPVANSRGSLKRSDSRHFAIQSPRETQKTA